VVTFSIAIVSSTVFANVSYAQLIQPLPPSSSPSVQSLAPKLTPEQQAKICDPSDTSVNTTESHICGKPATSSPSTSAASTIGEKNATGGTLKLTQNPALP
jgi:hypothetical protein